MDLDRLLNTNVAYRLEYLNVITESQLGSSFIDAVNELMGVSPLCKNCVLV